MINSVWSHASIRPTICAGMPNDSEIAITSSACSGGLIVNSSRGIIYVDKTEKFAEAARLAAQEVQVQMAEQLKAIL